MGTESYGSDAACLAEVVKRYPDILRRIWVDGEPRRFAIQYGRPVTYFYVRPGLMDVIDGSDYWLPLLESNGDCIYAENTCNGTFVAYYYGDREAKTVGTSFQQMLSFVFAELVDAGLLDVALLVAPEFGYRYTNELIAYANSLPGASFDDDLRRFVDSTT